MSVPESLFDLNVGSGTYLFLRNDDSKIAADYRCRVDEWWRRYAPILDKNFPQKFRNGPVQPYWELTVANLLENETDLQLRWDRRSSKTAPTPDFVTSYGEMEVWVEATTPRRGAEASQNAVAPLAFGEGSHVGGQEWHSLRLRILNSFSAKVRKLKALNPSGTSIIAIGAGEISSVQWHNNLLDWQSLAAVFYPFRPSFTVRLDGSQVPPTMEVDLEKAGTDKRVAKGFALRSLDHGHIAGVLFSTHTIASLVWPMEPVVYWVENPFSAASKHLRAAFAGVDRIIVHSERKIVEHLPPAIGDSS